MWGIKDKALKQLSVEIDSVISTTDQRSLYYDGIWVSNQKEMIKKLLAIITIHKNFVLKV